MSATATSFISCRPLQSLHLPTRIRPHSSFIPVIGSAAKYLSSNRRHQHLFRINHQGVASRRINMKINAGNLPPLPSARSGSSVPGWTGWVLLAVVAIVPILIHFFTGGGKLGSFKVFKKKVDSALDKVATIAEKIEDVAEVVDKIADEVVEHLPEGSKLRNIVEKLDDIAEKTIMGADLAEAILEKVDDMGDSVEAMLEASSKVAVDTERLNSDMDQIAVAADKMESDMDQVRVAISEVYDEKKEMSKDQAAGTTTVSAKEKKEY